LSPRYADQQLIRNAKALSKLAPELKKKPRQRLSMLLNRIHDHAAQMVKTLKARKVPARIGNV